MTKVCFYLKEEKTLYTNLEGSKDEVMQRLTDMMNVSEKYCIVNSLGNNNDYIINKSNIICIEII